MIEKLKNSNTEEKDEGRKKPSMEDMSKERDEKIKTFRYKKTLSEKLKVSIIFKINRESKKKKTMITIENFGLLI